MYKRQHKRCNINELSKLGYGVKVVESFDVKEGFVEVREYND